jgi:PhoH-like ATPase
VNEYLLDDSQHFAGLVESVSSEHLDVLDLGYERLMGRRAWGITPKNIGQAMGFHSLLDPHIDLVILTGPAGSGKTGITSTIISIFVQTSVKMKSLAQILQINIIKNLSFTNQMNTSSKLSLGECYV